MYEKLCERFELIGMDAKKVLGSFACELSGGMKQRAVIGLSTLLNPKVVIADEPTSALDVSTQKAVIELMLDLLDKRIFSSAIFITHELALLKHVADRIAIMYAGEFVEFGETDQVLLEPAHSYTKALMDSMLLPEALAGGHKPRGLDGAPPKLSELRKGCRFAPRCKEAREDCAREDQVLRTVNQRQVRCKYV